MIESKLAPPRPQLPEQPIPKPNNIGLGQPMQATRIASYLTYSISSMECNYIHLRYGKRLTKDQPRIHVEYFNEDVWDQ
jgi:hypothetical protein